MKNKIILILTAILAMSLMMTGCGSNTADSQEASSQSAGEAGFIFESGDTKVVMNAETTDILESLGKETDYFEAESCAFKGIDKTYTYSGFRLYTYPVDEVDYVLSVEFMDDSVSTTEGLSIGDTKEKVIETYGEDYEDSESSIIYTKGKSQLKFILDSGEVISSIEYLAVTD